MNNHVLSIDLALEVLLGCLALHSVLILCYFKPQVLYYKNALLMCYSANLEKWILIASYCCFVVNVLVCLSDCIAFLISRY